MDELPDDDPLYGCAAWRRPARSSRTWRSRLSRGERRRRHAGGSARGRRSSQIAAPRDHLSCGRAARLSECLSVLRQAADPAAGSYCPHRGRYLAATRWVAEPSPVAAPRCRCRFRRATPDCPGIANARSGVLDRPVAAGRSAPPPCPSNAPPGRSPACRCRCLVGPPLPCWPPAAEYVALRPRCWTAGTGVSADAVAASDALVLAAAGAPLLGSPRAPSPSPGPSRRPLRRPGEWQPAALVGALDVLGCRPRVNPWCRARCSPRSSTAR